MRLMAAMANGRASKFGEGYEDRRRTLLATPGMLGSVARFLASRQGNMSIGWLMGVLLFILIAASVIPLAVNTIVGTDTTTWDDGSAALWVVIPIVIVASVVYMIARNAGMIGKS